MKNDNLTLSHGNIKEVFKNIYLVCGTNITYYNQVKIQHSRNMVIIKNANSLTLINTVQLNEDGLKQLDELGTVKHVIRIGAFHGRDDAFYLKRYHAEFWSFPDADITNTMQINHVLSSETQLPIEQSHLHIFTNAKPAEGFIYLQQNDGILITCDSIKNWLKVDEFFSEETGEMHSQAGEIQKARISPIWLNATGTSKSDFDILKSLKYKHLISAHGDVLYDTAYEDIKKSISEIETK